MSRELHHKGSRLKTTTFSSGFLRALVHFAKLVMAIAIRVGANSTAAIAVLFAVALVLAVGDAVLVSVDVFGANIILRTLAAAFVVLLAQVLGLNAVITLARRWVGPGLVRGEVGGIVVGFTVKTILFAAVLILDRTVIARFPDAKGRSWTDGRGQTDSGSGRGSGVLLPVAVVLVDVNAALNVGLVLELLEGQALVVVIGDNELDVDGEEGVDGIVGEAAHLELDDVELLVNGRGEVGKVGHLKLSVLAGVINALAPKLGILLMLAVNDHVRFLGVLVAKPAGAVVILVFVPVRGVVVLPVLVVDDVDAEGIGAFIGAEDNLVVGTPKGDGTVVCGVEAELPLPKMAIVAADGLTALDAHLVVAAGLDHGRGLLIAHEGRFLGLGCWLPHLGGGHVRCGIDRGNEAHGESSSGRTHILLHTDHSF
mmetsp:Transcript_14640/g.31566  ORF Transcript_14640/g.31566 Transcript_14640/m.31566 type:complete len:426 (+) Transcript_14640:144-1421(+)